MRLLNIAVGSARVVPQVPLGWFKLYARYQQVVVMIAYD